MSQFFDDTMQGLLEAIEIERGSIPIVEKANMPATTFSVADDSKELIDKVVEIRKNQNISQTELAAMTGSSQQAISRFEKKSHNASIGLFSSIVNALGYKIQLVKR